MSGIIGVSPNMKSGVIGLPALGSLIQSAHHHWDDTHVLGNDTSYGDATGSSFTFTPERADSTLLCNAKVDCGQNQSYGQSYCIMVFKLTIGSTSSAEASNHYRHDDADSSGTNGYSEVGATAGMELKYVSHTSTAGITCKIEWRNSSAAGTFDRRINEWNGGSYIQILEYAGRNI